MTRIFYGTRMLRQLSTDERGRTRIFLFYAPVMVLLIIKGFATKTGQDHSASLLRAGRVVFKPSEQSHELLENLEIGFDGAMQLVVV